MASTAAHEPDWAQKLHAHGLKVTQPRLAVLRTLNRHPHSSAEQIVELADQRPATLSVQSVYNVLADLRAEKLVRSLELPHRPGLYELDHRDNHHHAVCTNCDAVADVPCAVGASPCLTPLDNHGILVEIADVLYRGLCAACRDSNQTNENNNNLTGDLA
ncbi:MAG: Fur family transcriptional regulator [Propionibacteriaceae bacterium]|nr:Fur family transcriptional regulator [Propionibacteriaceae bacterium]